jgi:magnesium-transporting ATPase (P-type)
MNDIKKTKTEAFSEFIKSNLVNIAIVLICFAYVLRGLITIGATGKTWYEIVADGLLAFMVSVSIKVLMRKKGLNNGFMSDKFIATTNLYGKEIQDKVDGNTDQLEKYCEIKNEYRLKYEQRNFLLRNGLDYETFEKGEYDSRFEREPNRKIRRKKVNLLKKCRNLRVYKYTPVLITNAYSNQETEEKLLKQSRKQYESSKAVYNIFIGFIIMFLFGYYGIKSGNIEELWKNIIWCTLQVALFLAFGVIEMLNAFDFVTETLRGKINRVISIIDDFNTMRMNHPEYFVRKENKEDGKSIEQLQNNEETQS